MYIASWHPYIMLLLGNCARELLLLLGNCGGFGNIQKPNAKLVSTNFKLMKALNLAKYKCLTTYICQGGSRSTKYYFGFALKFLKDCNLGNSENCHKWNLWTNVVQIILFGNTNFCGAPLSYWEATGIFPDFFLKYFGA